MLLTGKFWTIKFVMQGPEATVVQMNGWMLEGTGLELSIENLRDWTEQVFKKK